MKVIKIEQCNPLIGGNAKARKLRAVAYARVSTGTDEQLQSYENQVNFYKKYIEANPDWSFSGIYSDAGISGLTVDARPGFLKMMKDAKEHKFDLIITKSVSRFARNTVDSLSAIRTLKENNIAVYFEKENINTLDSKGELLLTIMSSLAQEESRSISTNITWSFKKMMEKGKVHFAFTTIYGYILDGTDIIINEKEAEVVRLIFKLFIEGKNTVEVAEELAKRGIKSPKGKPKWMPSQVGIILENEKYMGDTILQKTYSADITSKKRTRNMGERTMYYVQNSNPAIISKEEFIKAQRMFNRARYDWNIFKRPNGEKMRITSRPLGGWVFCGECGAPYEKEEQGELWVCSRGEHESVKVSMDRLEEIVMEACGCAGCTFNYRMVREQIGRVEINPDRSATIHFASRTSRKKVTMKLEADNE